MSHPVSRQCILDNYNLIYSLFSTNLFITVPEPPTNVRATVLASRSVVATWKPSLPNAIGYLILYATTAAYASDGCVMVSGGSTTSHTLTNLEEDTLYAITVQTAATANIMSANSNEVSVRTYTDGK